MSTRSRRDSRIPGLPDAVTLLTADHREMRQLFQEYRRAAPAERVDFAQRICQALTAHAQIEEEIFYPQARDALGDERVDDAEHEHTAMERRVAQIDGMTSAAEMAEPMTLLEEEVTHHVNAEEEELFPALASKHVDLLGIGAALAARKVELTEAIGEDVEREHIGPRRDRDAGATR